MYSDSLSAVSYLCFGKQIHEIEEPLFLLLQQAFSIFVSQSIKSSLLLQQAFITIVQNFIQDRCFF